MVIEDAADLANYMKEYIKQYREEYNRIINNGYPRLDISPYLNSKEISCYLTNDYLVITDLSKEPDYYWYIAGGPGIVIDEKDTRIPKKHIELYEKLKLLGKDIGLYRVVYKDGKIPDYIWNGELDSNKIYSNEYNINGIRIKIMQYNFDIIELLKRLTFGVFGLVLPLPIERCNYSIIIRWLGFVTADKINKRFFNYLEIIPRYLINTNTIWQKVFFDVRRDYIHKLQMEDYIVKEKDGENGATVECYSNEKILETVDMFYGFKAFLKPSNITRLKDVVLNEFKSLLDKHDDERTFQKFLENNPVLLELFTKMLGAKIEPQPLFADIAKVTGNESRRPDFLIYYDTNYILIELEKPTKKLCTQRGEPSSELTQVVTQIADWKRIIKTSADLQQNYDGIIDNCNYIIIAGRKSNDESFNIFMNRFKDTHKDITLYTYDDFIEALEKYIKRLEELFD